MHPAGRVSRRSIVAPPQPVVKVMIGVIGHPTDCFLAADRFQVIRRQGMRSTTAMRPSAPLGRTQVGGRKRTTRRWREPLPPMIGLSPRWWSTTEGAW
jgi:hypothetical protein